MTTIYRRALLKRANEMKRPGLSSIWDSAKAAALYGAGRWGNDILNLTGRVVDKTIGGLTTVGRATKKTIIDPSAWPGRKVLEGGVSAFAAPFQGWAYNHRPKVRYDLDMTAPKHRKIR